MCETGSLGDHHQWFHARYEDSERSCFYFGAEIYVLRKKAERSATTKRRLVFDENSFAYANGEWLSGNVFRWMADVCKTGWRCLLTLWLMVLITERRVTVGRIFA